MRRPRLLPSAALSLFAAAAVLTAVPLLASPTVAAAQQPSAPVGPVVNDPDSCPSGSIPEGDESEAERESGETPGCRDLRSPEPAGELLAMNAQISARNAMPGGTVPAAALAAAVQARAAVPTASADRSWAHYGKGPLINDNPTFTTASGLGLQDIAGRVEDFAQQSTTHWYAAVAQGGVWETTDAGAGWTSIGDNLPTQIVGSVAWTPAGGGTLIANTGDPAFGGSSNAGLGLFWTSDGGATWTKSTVPGGTDVGTLGFRTRVDPTDPSVVYAATGKGLYRSADAGRSFTDVNLPTTCTDTTLPDCFFANIVTDAVVQPGSGKVLAVVGWRAGTKPNVKGAPQAPQNGLYTSTTGAVGSFTYVAAPSGYPALVNRGRTALAVATGAKQDTAYVYALVEDANKFNGQAGPASLPSAGALNRTGSVLNGLYGSGDFGATWTMLATPEQLAAFGGSSIGASSPVTGYGPGVQSWYDLWIEVDPTAPNDVTGAPGRIAFGLEEIWSGGGGLLPAATNVPVGAAAPVPVNTSNDYHVIGRYFAGNSCAGFTLPNPSGICPVERDPAGGGVGNGPDPTTHPDQQGSMFVDNGDGTTTLVVGNDGGAYKQTVSNGAPFDIRKWGRGLQGSGEKTMTTLLPYDVAVAKDGVAYAGLQDNGDMRIENPAAGSKQYAIYGGDGFYAATDPDDSNVTYEEYTNGAVAVSTNGGKTFSRIDPALTASLFATPFVMDPQDANHLVIGGRDIKERLTGPNGGAAAWTTVYDLGTAGMPGDAGATASATSPNNQLSAVDTRGDTSYVAYCGYCDIVTQGTPFRSGIATNAGAATPAQKGTAAGWHIAKAAGLPQRYVTDVLVDPADPKTVYATIAGYGRRWIPPGSLGDDTSKIGSGHVFVSRDAGESFTDLSGNLPDEPANAVEIFNGGLVVGTDSGVYTAPLGTVTATWSKLGSALPTAPVFGLTLDPNPTQTRLFAASYGRGVQVLSLTDAVPPTDVPEVPLPVVLPLVGAGLVLLLLHRRRRSLA